MPTEYLNALQDFQNDAHEYAHVMEEQEITDAWQREEFEAQRWKQVIGYEGRYEVSDFGNVRSLGGQRFHYNSPNKIRTIVGREMKFYINPDGYYSLGLCKNNSTKSVRVHRLVAEAFIPNHDNLPIINHKNFNKLNNCVNNLEWCDQKYNGL